VMKQVAKHDSILQDIRRVCPQVFLQLGNVSTVLDDQSSA
jgi:hypothetical protein